MVNNSNFRPTKQLLATIEEDLEALESIYQCGLAQERISNDVLSLGRIQLGESMHIPDRSLRPADMSDMLRAYYPWPCAAEHRLTMSRNIRCRSRLAERGPESHFDLPERSENETYQSQLEDGRVNRENGRVKHQDRSSAIGSSVSKQPLPMSRGIRWI